MTPEIIQIILWIPFGLVVLISGLIFCISGYKKGLWRALIALAATVLAAVLSMLLAKLVGQSLASNITAALPPEIFSGYGLPEELMTDIVSGVVKMGISLVAFPVLMFFLTILLRAIGYNICAEKLQPKTKLMQTLGMVTGGVSALVYTVLLLLPLYGTLGSYLPVVESLFAMQSEKDPVVQQYLEAVTSHPVVNVSGSGPAASFYSGLASLEVGDAALDIPRMARTMDEIMGAVEAVSEAESNEERIEKIKDLVDVMRHDVVDQVWFYEMTQDGIDMFREAIPPEETGPEVELVQDFLDIVDCPQEDFAENCTAIFDFFAYVLEQDVIDVVESEDINAIYDKGIVAEAGKLANCTPEAVKTKKLLLSIFFANTQGMEYDQAKAYVNSLGIDAVTDPQTQLKEAEALIMVMLLDEDYAAEAIMRYPGMGEKVLQQRIDALGFAAAMGIQDEKVAQQVNNDPAAQQQIMTVLREYASKPLGEELFDSYISSQYGY